MKKIIMIVDDDPDIVGVTTHCLQYLYPSEFMVLSANNGDTCLKILKSVTPDIILLDIMIPGINGWEIYDKLKMNQNWRDIPIIFLTARDDKTAKNTGKLLGDGFIQKPFDIDELKKNIDKTLEKKQ